MVKCWLVKAMTITDFTFCAMCGSAKDVRDAGRKRNKSFQLRPRWSTSCWALQLIELYFHGVDYRSTSDSEKIRKCTTDIGFIWFDGLGTFNFQFFRISSFKLVICLRRMQILYNTFSSPKIGCKLRH